VTLAVRLVTVCAVVVSVGGRVEADPTLQVSPSGHCLAFGPETFVLVGDSGTRCVMQDANLE